VRGATHQQRATHRYRAPTYRADACRGSADLRSDPGAAGRPGPSWETAATRLLLKALAVVAPGDATAPTWVLNRVCLGTHGYGTPR